LGNGDASHREIGLAQRLRRKPGSVAEEHVGAGRELYLRYCGACHGPAAKGDGIVASFMRVKPADLTLISARHGGEFPLGDVVKTIDGREMLRAHGEPAMPVWGEILSSEIGGGSAGACRSSVAYRGACSRSRSTCSRFRRSSSVAQRVQVAKSVPSSDHA
jgi:hypothetical protein